MLNGKSILYCLFAHYMLIASTFSYLYGHAAVALMFGFGYVLLIALLLREGFKLEKLNKLMVLDDLGAAYPARNWIEK